MTFKEQIEQELKKLNKNQQREFAWRCAIYALPFLGSEGNFKFWEEKDIQIKLYNIFHALDIATVSIMIPNMNVEIDAAIAAVDTIFGSPTISRVTKAIAYSIRTSSNVVYASYAAAAANRLKNGVLEYKLLNYIKTLNKERENYILMGIYGKVWTTFQSILKSKNCEYWANWYQKLFENNFKFDEKEVKARINLPEEIRNQGAAIVGQYIQKLKEEGAERLNEARILILGEKGVGKTCVARKLIDPNANMTTPEESTAGVDTSLWVLWKEKMNVRIWDFAGHTVTHAVHQFFLSERCLYILVYDGRTEDRNRLVYWLNQMKNYGGDSQAIILVNERDQHSVNIPINYLKENYPIAGFYSFNIDKDKAELKQFRKEVGAFIINNPSWKSQEIPKSYYQVKAALERRFNRKGKKGQEHISIKAFQKIAKDYAVEAPEKLLQDLHFLGISLWYKQMEAYQTLILNPEWISQGVYQIINWVSNQNTYSLTLACFDKAFEINAERFPKDKHPFLFELIKHYELAFETWHNKRLIIPHLLEEDQPKKLPVFDSNEDLSMRYEADQVLPSNTISRFIVRHNTQIKGEKEKLLVWRYGVILEDGKGSLALVREKDRSISVSVKGKRKTEYISELRATLNAIFETYKTKRPTLNYKIIDSTLLPVQQEVWVAEQEIAALHQRNKPYYDYRRDSNIPMKPTVIQYNITNHFHVKDVNTLIMGGKGHQVTNNTFNFHDCSLDLQGSLNELARKLVKKGNTEDVEELEEAIEVLEEIQEGADKKEVKKKGIVRKLRRIVEDLGDEDSTIHKAIEGVKNGVSIAQDIAEQYNKVAQWLGLPQVPKPFLKKE